MSKTSTKTQTRNKRKRAKPRPVTVAAGNSADRVRHMHVVVDDTLYTSLEAHARKLEALPKNDERQPNLSAAARDAMRRGLGLPTANLS